MRIKKMLDPETDWKGPNRWNYNVFRVFPKLHKVGNNANVGIRGFIMRKQNIPVKILTPSEY